MTDAQNVSAGLRSAAAEVAAERYGMPIIDGDRAVLIAALHTVINWLIDHPGIPCPQVIELIAHPTPDGLPTKTDLVELAQLIDGRVASGGNGRTVWADKLIPLGEGAGGVKARYVAYGADGR